MDKSDIEFLDNGNIKIFGQEYTESFFRIISKEISSNKHIYLTEENGMKTFHEVNSEDVIIFDTTHNGI